MENAAPAPSCPAASPGSDQGRPGATIPARIAAFLQTLRILLNYGRHLTETVSDRAAAPSFASIAVCFGTARLETILAHLQRGLLRAIALERVLLARAARGRDIALVVPRLRSVAESPAPAADPPALAADGAAAPSAPVARTAAARPARPAGWNDPTLYMPTLEELEARVRRRPLGQTIIEICLDLAVVPGICTGPFWNELFDLMRCYGGTLATLMQERCRREKAFADEQDRGPTRSWAWWDQKRETIRAALGFFIGEPPVIPFGLVPAVCLPAATAATGPP
jgi:hypothetical protein